MQNNKRQLLLGCGLIRIGRTWGVRNSPIPSEKEVQAFLEYAFDSGIRFFDTAPAYGLSEERLGRFIKNLTPAQKKHITVSTKFGEHWNSVDKSTYVDHSSQALIKSLDASMKKLGKIDVLQLHKTTKEVLLSHDVDLAYRSAKEMGIKNLGASISDLKSGFAACEDQRLTYMQLPYNEEKTELLPVIEHIKKQKKKALFNRPFAMGAIVADAATPEEKEKKMIQAYRFIQKTDCPGIVLSGTASREHLRQNIACFEKALHTL